MIEAQRIKSAMLALWCNRADVERRVPGFYADMRRIYLARLDALRKGNPTNDDGATSREANQAVEAHR